MCEFESDQDMNLFKAIERLHLAGIAEQAFFDHLEKCKQCADAVYDEGITYLPLCDEGTKLDGPSNEPCTPSLTDRVLGRPYGGLSYP